MLRKRTCLILGAGASCHLGFPLGAGLKDLMLKNLRRYRDGSEKLPTALVEYGEDLNAFYEELAFGNWYSPDAFLEKRREFINSGKYMMCDILSKLENEDRLVDQSGWYIQVRDAIHADDIDEFNENQLTIITFNYDRSVDCWLHRYVRHQFRLSHSDAWALLSDAIPIIHVHGTLGEYPNSPYGDRESIEQKATSIKIISEVADGAPEFQQAARFISEAERVIVFGFGFATDNVRRLRFFEEKSLEERDVIVAAGASVGRAHTSNLVGRLGTWGLQREKHFWTYNCNEFCSHALNPFS